MAKSDALQDLLDRMLAGDEEYEPDYEGTDKDTTNEANTLDEAIMTLDAMADKGVELADLLIRQKKFMAQAFATMAALVVAQGGRAEITKDEMRATGDRLMAAKWEGDVLVLTVSAKAVSE